MSKIQFDYEVWKPQVDGMPEFPLTELAIAVVQSDVEVGRYNTRKEGTLDPLIGPSIQGVIQMLTASLEWCRKYGLSTSEVEARVRAYLEAHKGTKRQRVLRDAYEAEQISDPQGLLARHDSNKVVI